MQFFYLLFKFTRSSIFLVLLFGFNVLADSDFIHKLDKNLSTAESVRQWLLSTNKFLGSSPESLRVAIIGHVGGRENIGGYSVTQMLDNGEQKRYFLKVVNDYGNNVDLPKIGQIYADVPESLKCSEFREMFNLNSHPSISANSNTSKLKIPKILEAGRFENICFGLLEWAPGSTLRDLTYFDQASPVIDKVDCERRIKRLGKMFSNVGSSHSQLHFKYAVQHGDSNFGNILYEEVQELTTLVDHAGMGPLSPSCHEFDSSQVFSEIMGKTVQDLALILLDDRASELNYELSSEKIRLCSYLSYARGYLKAVPEELRSAKRSYLSELCQQELKPILFVIKDHHEQAQFYKSIEHYFPELDRCIKGYF